MNDRPIHVTLNMDEYMALKNMVSDKLKSFTDFDWDSGPNDLDAANSALTAAWKRWMRRRPA